MASGTFYASARIAATTAAPPPSAHPLAVIKPRHPDPRWSAVVSFVDCQTCESAEPFVTYVRIAISAPPAGASRSKRQLGHPDFSIVGVSLFPSYHGATLPGVDRRGVVSNTLAPLAGVFVLERHIRRVRVGRVT